MKQSKDAKILIDSLIPLGMIFGSAFGVVFGIFLKPSLLVFTISAGACIGYFIGVIAFGLYSKEK